MAFYILNGFYFTKHIFLVILTKECIEYILYIYTYNKIAGVYILDKEKNDLNETFDKLNNSKSFNDAGKSKASSFSDKTQSSRRSALGDKNLTSRNIKNIIDNASSSAYINNSKSSRKKEGSQFTDAVFQNKSSLNDSKVRNSQKSFVDFDTSKISNTRKSSKTKNLDNIVNTRKKTTSNLEDISQSSSNAKSNKAPIDADELLSYLATIKNNPAFFDKVFSSNNKPVNIQTIQNLNNNILPTSDVNILKDFASNNISADTQNQLANFINNLELINQSSHNPNFISSLNAQNMQTLANSQKMFVPQELPTKPSVYIPPKPQKPLDDEEIFEEPEEFNAQSRRKKVAKEFTLDDDLYQSEDAFKDEDDDVPEIIAQALDDFDVVVPSNQSFDEEPEEPIELEDIEGSNDTQTQDVELSDLYDTSADIQKAQIQNQAQTQNQDQIDEFIERIIPESEQQDIIGLVDISLTQNVDALILAQRNAGSAIDTVVEDLVVSKIKRSKKFWILLVLLLAFLGAGIYVLKDLIFAQKANEESVSGMTLIVMPSNNLNPTDENAEYIFFPGGIIPFKDNVKAGSERYRNIERPDGSIEQRENAPFAFRFKINIKFENEEDFTDEDLIEYLIDPNNFAITNNADYTIGTDDFIYYNHLIIPGEPYKSFLSGIRLRGNTISNDFQNMKFTIIMTYTTVVPSSHEIIISTDPTNPNAGAMEEAPTEWRTRVVEQYKSLYE